MTSSNRLAGKALSVLAYAVGGLVLGMVALIVIHGGRWTWSAGALSISAARPGGRLALGVFAFFLGRICWIGRAAARARWKTWAGHLLLLVLGVGIAGWVGEQALREWLRRQESRGSLEQLARLGSGEDIAIRNPHALAGICRVSSNRILAYELRPNLDMSFGGHVLRTNAEGMREDVNYPREKPPGTVRILGLGDSGLFGWASDQGETILDYLEANLNKRPDPWRYEVLNLAVPGYNTLQELEMLKERGLAYGPDIVIVHWCANDIYPPFFVMRQREFRERDISYLRLLLFDRTTFYRRLEPQVMSLDQLDRQHVDPRWLEGTGMEGVYKALQEGKRLAAQHGFRLLVMGPMADELVSACQKEGVPFWNTYSLRQEDYPDLNIHGMHPRPRAGAVLAEHLEQELARLGWLSPDR